MIRNDFILIFMVSTLTSCTGYIIENDGVYYKDWNEAQGQNKRLIKNADPETFEILKDDDYGKDNKFVFFRGSPINGADPKSFEFVGDMYAKDRYRAYYAGDSIQSSSSKDFKIIDGYYSSDYKDIYYTTEPLHVCNTKDFKIFPNPNNENEYQRWATDGCYYYFQNFKIPSDDYKNVFIFKESLGIAKDKKWVYMLNRKMNFNEEGKRILDTVDVATFTVSNYLDCKDKFGCINVYQGRNNCDTSKK